MAMNNNNRHPGVKLLYSVSFDWISQFTPILLEKERKENRIPEQKSYFWSKSHKSSKIQTRLQIM